MLDIEEINRTISDLENKPTSMRNCEQLATLYICREYAKNGSERHTDENSDIISEYSDILPAYRHYIDVKREFQKDLISYDVLFTSMQDLCTEIEEFILTLYNNTESETERNEIKRVINKLFTNQR